MVALVILSLLAAAALPYAQKTVQRNKELELHRALRTIRTAIDRFHEDWQSGVISHLDNVASQDGYPRTLAVLVDGVERNGASGRKIRYLRRIPRDPFADPAVPPAQQWRLRGYQDDPGATWGGADVYDVTSRSEDTALDGTSYRDW